MFLEAILTIYRPALGGLEGYFTFIFAVGASCLVHFPGAVEITPASKSTVSHFNISVRAFYSAHSKGEPSIYTYVLYIIFIIKCMYVTVHQRHTDLRS